MKPLGYISTFSAAILLTACGSSSDGDGITNYCGDQLDLMFPSAYSATLSNQITVRGASDCSTINSVSVNGVTATTEDSFGNWRANISLQAGRNSIRAQVVEGDKTHQLELAVIESNELFQSPDDMAISSDGSTLYAMDPSRRQIVKVDTVSGARTVLSSGSDASQLYPFGNMYDVALNEADSVLYVISRYIVGMTSTDVGVIAVDLSDGSRTLAFNPDDLKGGETTFNARSMVYDAERKRIYISDQEVLYWIDLDPSGTPGKMSVLSNNTIPNSNNLWGDSANIDLVLDSANDRLIASDNQAGQILAVSLLDVSLGERSVLLSASDEENTLNIIEDIVLKDSNSIYISDYARDGDDHEVGVHEYNVTTNTLNQVFNSTDTNNQRPFEQGAKLAYSAASSQLWASNYYARSIASIDLSQGSYENRFYNLDVQVTGETEILKSLSRHALDSDNQKIYYEVDDNSLYTLNLKTGERNQWVQEIQGDGINGDATESMGYDATLQAIITTGELTESGSGLVFGNVVAWPVDSSNAYVITDAEMDTDSPFKYAWDWVRLNETDGIAVDDTSSPSLYYQTNIQTGVRTELEMNLSSVPASLEVEDMEISLDKSTLFVTDDSGSAGVYAIDLATKTARIITDATMPADGNDFRFGDPESLAVATDGEHVYVGDNNRAALVKVNIETGSRETLIYETNESTNSWAERIQGISVDHDRQLIYTSCDSEHVFLMMDEVTNEWVIIAE